MQEQKQVMRCTARPFGYECGEPAAFKVELIFSQGKIVKYACKQHLDHVTDDTVMWMLSLLGMQEKRVEKIKEG